MVKIPAAIEAMDLSRQRKLQLTYRSLNRCILCGKKKCPESDDYCTECLVARREATRQRKGSIRRNYGAPSYRYTAEKVPVKGKQQIGHKIPYYLLFPEELLMYKDGKKDSIRMDGGGRYEAKYKLLKVVKTGENKDGNSTKNAG